jgi:histidinol-phosphate aminotransferase
MKYWNSTLKKMTEYMPGEQPEGINEYIKLNTNENPFPPFESVLKALKEAANGNLRRYPDPLALEVRKIFAEQNSLSPDNVFIGNGSDEIFTLIFRGFAEKNAVTAFPYPSYSLYGTLAEACGVKYEKIPLDAEMNLNFSDFLKKEYSPVIITNPNNPTGTWVELKAVKEFLKNFKGLLVVDEAYVDFYGNTCISLVREFDNVIVTRSLSKSYSLAGLRVGIAAANEEIIRGFLKLKDSYNLDRIALEGARAALLDKKTFRYNIEMVIHNKEYLENGLAELGFKTFPSQANFVFTKHPKVSSKEIYLELKERKILVRYFEGPVQSEYFRVTVGTMMEIKTLLKELKSITEA